MRNRNLIREQRKELGLTLSECEVKSGIPRQTLTSIEASGSPNLSKIEKYIDTIGLELVVAKKEVKNPKKAKDEEGNIKE